MPADVEPDPLLEPVLMEMLTIHSNGASVAELAVYIERPIKEIRSTLDKLRSEGRVRRLSDPMIPAGKLWATPALTKLPPTLRATPPAHGKYLKR